MRGRPWVLVVGVLLAFFGVLWLTNGAPLPGALAVLVGAVLIAAWLIQQSIERRGS